MRKVEDKEFGFYPWVPPLGGTGGTHPPTFESGGTEYVLYPPLFTRGPISGVHRKGRL